MEPEAQSTNVTSEWLKDYSFYALVQDGPDLCGYVIHLYLDAGCNVQGLWPVRHIQ